MIRPRRTFQDKNMQSAARWDRVRAANKLRGWVRVGSLVCFFGSILFIINMRMSKSSGDIGKIAQENPSKPETNYHFVLGANEATELLPISNQGEKSDTLDLDKHIIDEDHPVEEEDEPNLPEETKDGPEDLESGVIVKDSQSKMEEIERVEIENPEPERTEDNDAEAADEEHDEDADSEKKIEAVISSDGTVGGSEIGGTYDGSSVVLFPQITLPDQPIIQHYDSTQNYWPLHAILKERGWAYATMALPSRVTLWISRGSVPPRLKQGYQMLNSMGVSGCIGGAKSLQLECRRRLARLNGCEYDVLKIQPPQYNMLNLDDCKRFFADAEKPERANKVYLSKPTYTYHGAGIRVHQGATGSLKHEFGSCKSPKNTILMDYIANPATMMGGYKFDFRTYVLVASLKPQMVFYHDGFVRKSDKVFDLGSKDLNVHITNKVTQSKEEHFFNFTTLGNELHRELGLPLDHLDKYVRPRAKAVTRFLFQTTLVQPKPPRHVPGRFHLFGIDWMLDAKGQLHLLEGNGYPLVSHYAGIDLTPRIWEEMMDLILAIQTRPVTLPKKMTVQDGYSFGGWKLVFNELEELMEQAKGNPYNSCNAFAE